jgi:hypothetical protein
VPGIAAEHSAADGWAALVQVLGEVDVLVDNVDVFELKPFEEISDSDRPRCLEA